MKSDSVTLNPTLQFQSKRKKSFWNAAVSTLGSVTSRYHTEKYMYASKSLLHDDLCYIMYTLCYYEQLKY